MNCHYWSNVRSKKYSLTLKPFKWVECLIAFESCNWSGKILFRNFFATFYSIVHSGHILLAAMVAISVVYQVKKRGKWQKFNGFHKIVLKSILLRLQLSSISRKIAQLLNSTHLYNEKSRVAQWKRAGPITQRSVDRNYALLVFFYSVKIVCNEKKIQRVIKVS